MRSHRSPISVRLGLVHLSVVALAACATQHSFGLDPAGRIVSTHYPVDPAQVQMLRPPGDLDDAYRMLMLRCAAVEAEQSRTLRVAWWARLLLGVTSAASATASTTLVSINEVQEGGSFSANRRDTLKAAAAVTGGVAVLASAVLGLTSVDSMATSKTIVVQTLRQSTDAVRALWNAPGANRPELLVRLANACGGYLLLEASAASRGATDGRAAAIVPAQLAAVTKVTRALDRVRELEASGRGKEAVGEVAGMLRDAASDCRQIAVTARALQRDDVVDAAFEVEGALNTLAAGSETPLADAKKALAQAREALDAIGRLLSGRGSAK